MDEKFAALIQLHKIEKLKGGTTDQTQELVEQIGLQGLTKEYEEYRHKPAPIVPVIEDDFYCPRCGARLTVRAEDALKHGNLVLCTNNEDAWLFIRPGKPEQIFLDD